jgi:hypothetical protein
MEKLNFEQVKGYLIACGGCEKLHLPISELHNGKSYCLSCKEKIEKCAVKNEFFLKEQMTYFEVQDIWVHEPDQTKVVKSCVSKKNLYRGGLYESAPKEKVIKIRDKDEGYALLEEFERNDYIKLSGNERYAKKREAFNWAGEYYRKSTAVGDIIRSGNVVSNYSTKPNPTFSKTIEKIKEYKNSKGESEVVGIPYLGFELEMSVIPISSGEPSEEGTFPQGIHSSDQERMKIASEEMLKYLVENKIGELMYFKKDSSVLNGWETVTHPATFSYWNNLDFRGFFAKAAELGLQSHDTCGLHVHVSRDALTKKQWWTLVSLIGKNANKLIKLSRRDRTKLNYCKWHGQADLTGALAEGKNIFNIFPNQKDRGSAINFNPKHTVEFRLFRSTHSAEELLASLALVEALVLFARKYSFMYVQDARTTDLWAEFVDFSRQQGYGNLIRFMEDMGVVKSKIKKHNIVCV